MRQLVMVGAAWALAAMALAEAPRLILPLECSLGTDCFIQQFVDHEPGPGVTDFACSKHAYDGHTGTDFRVSAQAFDRRVAVLAPADGVVSRVRDGIADRPGPGAVDPEAVDGQECGNGVLIDHGGGWVTQLCHLARGSVRVSRGGRVAVGEKLGRVGLSGKTEFRHLHLTLRKDGQTVDPFAPNLRAVSDCATGGATLWQDPAVPLAAQQVSRLIAAGVTGDVPDMTTALSGSPNAAVTHGVPLIVWAVGINLNEDDAMWIELRGPADERVLKRLSPVARRQAQFLSYAGRRPPEGGWSAGNYDWRVEIRRAGKVLDSREGSFRL